MKSSKIAQLSLCSIALGTLMVVVSSPALSQFTVFDPAVFGQAFSEVLDSGTEIVNQGTQIANEASQIQNQVSQIKQLQQQLESYKQMATSGPGGVAAVLSDFGTLARTYPTAAGDQFGLDQADGSGGAITSSNVDSLESQLFQEGADTASPIKVEQAVGEIQIYQLKQAMAEATLQTALSNQRQAQVHDSLMQRGEMLGVNQTDPTVGMLY